MTRQSSSDEVSGGASEARSGRPNGATLRAKPARPLMLVRIAIAISGLTGGGVWAQEPTVPQRGQDRDPHMPAPSQTVPEKRGEGSLTVTNDKGQSLSGRPGSGAESKT